MTRKIITAIIAVALLVTQVGTADAGSRVVRKNFVVKQKLVDLGYAVQIVGVPVTNLGPEYYYRIARSQNGEGISEEDINRIADAVVINLIKTLKLDEPQTPLPTDPNNPDQPTPDEPPVDPTPPDPSVEIERAVFAIASAKCAQCHSGDVIKGNLEIIKDGKMNKVARDVKFDMWDQTFSGNMPKNGDPLSDEEVEAFRAWARIK